MRIIVYILLCALIAFALYKYFALDINNYFKESIKERNFKKAEQALGNAIATKLTAEAKDYFYNVLLQVRL